jgi:hypothetical protein
MEDRTITGVSVALGAVSALFIIAVIGLLMKRKKRKLAEQPASETLTTSEPSGFHNNHLNELYGRRMPNEAGSQPLHEIGNSQGIGNTIVEVG